MIFINAREITYYDVSPQAAQSAQAQAGPDQIQPFSQLKYLFAEDITYRNIQTCERNNTALDGAHREFLPDENIALWSRSQSLYPSRMMPENIDLGVAFGGYQTSPGITLRFDPQNNIWCDALKIKWLKDGVLLSEKIFYPDAPVYACRNAVELYNSLTIEFIRLNMPGRFLRLEAVMFGIVRVFGDGDLESLNINEGFDPACRTLFINSAGFTLNAGDDIPYIFLKRQPLHIKYNGAYMGAYYIDRSKKYAESRYAVEAVDKIGVLDASDDFMGGMYENIPAGEIIRQITGGLFSLEIDENINNKTISGWLPVMKRRGGGRVEG